MEMCDFCREPTPKVKAFGSYKICYACLSADKEELLQFFADEADEYKAKFAKLCKASDTKEKVFELETKLHNLRRAAVVELMAIESAVKLGKERIILENGDE